MLSPSIIHDPWISLNVKHVSSYLPLLSMILGYLLMPNIILVICLCYPWFLDISVYQTSSLLSPFVIHDPWIFLYVKHYPCYLPLLSMILGYLLMPNIILVISLCYPWSLDISVYQTLALLSPSVIHDPWISRYAKHHPCYLPLLSMILGYLFISNIILVISLCHPWSLDISVYQTSSLLSPYPWSMDISVYHISSLLSPSVIQYLVILLWYPSLLFSTYYSCAQGYLLQLSRILLSYALFFIFLS